MNAFELWSRTLTSDQFGKYVQRFTLQNETDLPLRRHRVLILMGIYVFVFFNECMFVDSWRR
jgi:hypothetical protein